MIGPGDDTGGSIPPTFFIVEWSDYHRHFHVVRAGEAFEANFRDWLSGRRSDYRPLAIKLTREEAEAFVADAIKLRMVDRNESTFL